MWMKITFLLAALLVWDAATTDNNQSALQRGAAALMSFGPVQDAVDYISDGDMLDDLSAMSAPAIGTVSAALSGVFVDDSKALAAREARQRDRAARRAAREERRAELRLAPEDIAKIADAVTELYKEEKAKADVEPQQSEESAALPAPTTLPPKETVEQSVASLGPDLLGAIVKASEETGANSGYLLHIALRESGLALTAAAPTSSATGPFQFISQTWFQMLGVYGADHGLDAEVALLSKGASGKFTPVSEEAREELLGMRTDPYVSALMAGELTMENAATLKRLLGRAPAHGELYAAHVFGASGAAKLVLTREEASATSAAAILPSAASANRWLFYTSAGTARSVSALFDELSRFMSTREVATVCNANLNFFGS
tara:strand:- start:15800 stop:16924 length:1125 start_codon:yes stop_codon:yes gene_type:complete